MNNPPHPDQPIGPALPNWTPPAFPLHETLEGRFCRLEPLNADLHAQELHAANALDKSGKNWTYLPYGPLSDFDEYKDWLKTVCTGHDPQFYAVILKSTERAAGVTSFLRITPASGSIEVGHIHFSELLKRQPAATEAQFLMMTKVFDLGYRRYEWKCDALNAPSCQAAQRLGFSFEGVSRRATVYKQRNRDTAWFAITDAEWPAIKEAFTQWLAPENFDEKGKQRASLSDLTQPILVKTGPPPDQLPVQTFPHRLSQLPGIKRLL